MNIKQFGDFQTPPNLVRIVLDTLGPIGKKWDRVLEPTCGRGNFIQGIVESSSPPAELIGVELQDSYITEAESIHSSHTSITIIKANIFDINMRKNFKWKTEGPILVIGNPPWVTNSEIGAINGHNLPRKRNIKKLRGIDAITGSSNFDIAEFIWIKLISELATEKATIALLCKSSVAQKVLQYVYNSKLPISDAKIYMIDAKKWFGAAVDACLFMLKTGSTPPNYEALVYNSIPASSANKTLGFARDHLISDIHAYGSVSFIEGASFIEWRQGIKHDASSVMELSLKGGKWCNSLGDVVNIEDEYLFPLIKGSDIRHFSNAAFKRAVIVPQKRINENTKQLNYSAPKLWAYLSSHKKVFEARKSSVYKKRPPFSVFGIGNYSFFPYKVIVSGLHKEPRFISIGPFNSKPIFCDDTCYLLPCDSAIQAASIAAILNHPLCTKFIKSITFQDSKRPITKSVLKRIDLVALARRIALRDLQKEIQSYIAAMETEAIWKPPKSGNIAALLGFTNSPAQEILFDN